MAFDFRILSLTGRSRIAHLLAIDAVALQQITGRPIRRVTHSTTSSFLGPKARLCCVDPRAMRATDPLMQISFLNPKTQACAMARVEVGSYPGLFKAAACGRCHRLQLTRDSEQPAKHQPQSNQCQPDPTTTEQAGELFYEKAANSHPGPWRPHHAAAATAGTPPAQRSRLSPEQEQEQQQQQQQQQGAAALGDEEASNLLTDIPLPLLGEVLAFEGDLASTSRLLCRASKGLAALGQLHPDLWGRIPHVRLRCCQHTPLSVEDRKLQALMPAVAPNLRSLELLSDLRAPIGYVPMSPAFTLLGGTPRLRSLTIGDTCLDDGMLVALQALPQLDTLGTLDRIRYGILELKRQRLMSINTYTQQSPTKTDIGECSVRTDAPQDWAAFLGRLRSLVINRADAYCTFRGRFDMLRPPRCHLRALRLAPPPSMEVRDQVRAQVESLLQHSVLEEFGCASAAANDVIVDGTCEGGCALGRPDPASHRFNSITPPPFLQPSRATASSSCGSWSWATLMTPLSRPSPTMRPR